MKLLFYFELEIGRTKFNPRHSLFSWRLCEKLNPCFGMGEMRPDPQPHPSHHNKCGVNPNHTNHSSVNLLLCIRVIPYFSMGGEARDLTHSPIPATTLKCGVNPNHTNHSSVNFFPSLVPLCAFPSCYLC